LPGPRVITLGCRLNTLESEIMRSQANNAELDNTIIVNTCAVTAQAERQARQTIRRLRRDHPEVQIIVTGCAAQLKPEEFASMKEVNKVVGNTEKMAVNHLSGHSDSSIDVSDIMKVDSTLDVPLISGFENRTRAFVQVQQGCDHRCTFCIIPFARGPNRSISPEHILKQVQTLTENGHVEVVLTGVDVSSFGQDNEKLPTLGMLARTILDRVDALKRLRITSLDPAFVDDDILYLLANEERFMPHLHLSLQAADDIILKRMKRRHTRSSAFDLVDRARAARPDVVFGADLIAGFPTETDKMFENTLKAVDEMGLTYLHVFPYSKRPDTPAGKMPSVHNTTITERARYLREAGDLALYNYLKSKEGSTVEVLVEKNYTGHTQHFTPVDLMFSAPIGSIVDVDVIAINEEKGRLIADLVV
jgi:threonylcarbamoyladenosine tRNA methylthiotransferase MtaB